jgi:hypothetical protein
MAAFAAEFNKTDSDNLNLLSTQVLATDPDLGDEVLLTCLTAWKLGGWRRSDGPIPVFFSSIHGVNP